MASLRHAVPRQDHAKSLARDLTSPVPVTPGIYVVVLNNYIVYTTAKHLSSRVRPPCKTLYMPLHSEH